MTTVVRVVLALLLCPGLAAAQAPAEVERALLERQQQSDEFSLRLRQSQSGLNVRPEDRAELEGLQLRERQAQEQLHAEQQRQAVETPDGNRPGQAERFERERRAQELRSGSVARPESPITPLRRCGPADRDGVVSWTPTLEPCRP